MGTDHCGATHGCSSGAVIVAGPSVRGLSIVGGHPTVARFAFPAVPECPEPLPPAESPVVVWPDRMTTATASACAETVERIVRQLWDGGDRAGRSSDCPKVVAITSPGDGDGKTSLLLALAPVLAQRISGGTLVVDASYFKPDLTARLDMAERGRASGGRTAAAPATSQRKILIYPTSVPRLNVLPMAAERFDPNRQDQCVKRLTSWIEELREGWPLVLLDMPSLEHAEASRLARCCDAVYLVVRLGHTARRAVAEAAGLLRASGSRLLGCVVVN